MENSQVQDGFFTDDEMRSMGLPETEIALRAICNRAASFEEARKIASDALWRVGDNKLKGRAQSDIERFIGVLQTHGLGVNFLLTAANHFIIDRQPSDDCGEVETQILCSLEGYITQFEHSEVCCNYCGRVESDELQLEQVLDHTVINDGSQMITVCADCECE